MATPETLALRLEAIRKARDSGVLELRHGDESTTFRSLKEMDSIIRQLEDEIAAANGVKKPRVRYITQYCKGF